MENFYNLKNLCILYVRVFLAEQIRKPVVGLPLILFSVIY